MRIDWFALAIDDEPAGIGEKHRGSAHLGQMRTPAQLVLVSRLGESHRGVRRANRSPRRRRMAKRENRFVQRRVSAVIVRSVRHHRVMIDAPFRVKIVFEALVDASKREYLLIPFFSKRYRGLLKS
jgi:hypothetical protein